MTIGIMEPNPRTPSDDRIARLKRALTSLASLPDKGVLRASSDRHDAQILVVEFDDAYTAFVEGFEQLPSESQMVALQAVDTKLSAMVGAKDAALWTDRARREDQIWTELRELATDVIGKFS